MTCVIGQSHSEIPCSSGYSNSKEDCIDYLKQYNNNNPTNRITLIEYTDNESIVIIIIEIQNIKIKIITNFNTFCQANIMEIGKTTYIFNINNFMLKIIYTKKQFTDIIRILTNNTNQPVKRIVLNDYFHFNRKPFTKTPDINWEQFKTKFSKFKILNVKSKDKIVIPPDLVGLIKNNVESIINNMRTVNENSTHQHIIIPSDPLNHFIIKIKLSDKYKDIYEKYGEYIEFKLIINEQVYPIEPPKLEYIGTIPLTIQLLLTLENLSILTKSKWSTLMTFDYFIIKLAEQIENNLRAHIDENEDIAHKEYKENNKKLYSIMPSIQLLPINIELQEKLIRSSIIATGIGYGISNAAEWDWKTHELKQQEKQKDTITYLHVIDTIINQIEDPYINQSPFMIVIITYIDEFAILEYETKKDLYMVIFKCLLNLINKNISQDHINIISKKLDIILTAISQIKYMGKQELVDLNKLVTLYKNRAQVDSEDMYVEQTCLTCNEAYIKQMIILTDKYNTKSMDIDHYYKQKYQNEKTNYTSKTLQRILKEIKSVQGSDLPKDPLIHYMYDESKIQYGSFLIAGPVDTPYENGLFLFDIYYPPEFPNVPPHVQLKTTGGGTIRFNPNLYACGKVCLSLLGTWSGPGWTPQSTLYQILMSISSLILIDKPYFNEPGYERDINTARGETVAKAYNEKLMPSTIEWAMIDMIRNPPPGYEEIIKTHFKYKGCKIIETIDSWINKCTDTVMQQKIAFARGRFVPLTETI
jgi:ubiquitin-protein ligase